MDKLPALYSLASEIADTQATNTMLISRDPTSRPSSSCRCELKYSRGRCVSNVLPCWVAIGRAQYVEDRDDICDALPKAKGPSKPDDMEGGSIILPPS